MNTEKRELIEKAVRDLGGAWPKYKYDHNNLYQMPPEGDESDYAYTLDSSGSDLICTRDEFNHVVDDYRRLYEWDIEAVLDKSRAIQFSDWVKEWGLEASEFASRTGFQWRTEYKPERKIKSMTQNPDGTFTADEDIYGKLYDAGMLTTRNNPE